VILSVKNKVGAMHALSKNFWEGRIVKLLKPVLPAEITTKPNLLSLRFRFPRDAQCRQQTANVDEVRMIHLQPRCPFHKFATSDVGECL
jgi:hypothetical protein